MKTIRQEKLNSEFLRSINEILVKRIKDPRLTEMYTLTGVKTDAELSTAKVFVSIFSTDSKKAEMTFEALKDSAGHIRQILSREMHIRSVPKFEFVLDTHGEYGQRIDKLLNEISEKQDKN